jgi:hypothetical protein
VATDALYQSFLQSPRFCDSFLSIPASRAVRHACEPSAASTVSHNASLRQTARANMHSDDEQQSDDDRMRGQELQCKQQREDLRNPLRSANSTSTHLYWLSSPYECFTEFSSMFYSMACTEVGIGCIRKLCSLTCKLCKVPLLCMCTKLQDLQ